MERMPEEEDTVKTVFKNTPEGRRSVGKPRNKWLYVENCLKKMGVGGCRKIAMDRDGWKLIMKEVRDLHEL